MDVQESWSVALLASLPLAQARLDDSFGLAIDLGRMALGADVTKFVWGVFGMENTRKGRPRLRAVAAQFLVGIAGLALITFVCFWLGFGLARTGFAYVILIALVSLFGSFSASVVLSIVAAACLNYFFAPPLFELRIDLPEDIERIGIFLTTSLVVTAVMAKLRVSEARFRTFVDHATDAFFLLDDKSTVLDVNREACVSLGYSREELIGKHRSDFDASLDDGSIQSLRQRILAGESVTFESRHRRKDGSSFPVEIRVGQFEQNGRRFLCLVRDITDRRRAEDELRASEERFRSFVDHATDGFFLLDEHQAILDVNRQACESLGYSREEMIGMRPRDFDAGLDAASIARIGDRVTAGETVTFETLHRRKDGTVFPVEIRARQFQHGAHRFRMSIVRDATERKRAEDALRRSEAYLVEAQRLSHTGTIVFNATGPVYWSEESYRIWDLDPLQGLPDLETVLQRIHPDDRDRANKEAFEALHQARSYTFEFRIVLADGTVKYLESTGHPLLSSGGQPEMVATHVDVTERKRAQEEHERLRQLEADLAHVNRISIMGELAASLAHEILHPIATARNNARAGMRFLELSPPNLGEVKEALALVVRDADRAKDIVGRMRDHIKKAPPRREPFDLNEAIHEVIVTIGSAIDKNRVSVRTRLIRDLNPVLGDRVQVQQVVLNLILNSMEAMSSVDEGARDLSISTKQGPKSDILVAVQDSGPGIDPQHLEQVFAPFYTTKTSGIGMGLSICRSIVAAHGGRLWAEANRPRGAIFQFTLPAGQEDS